MSAPVQPDRPRLPWDPPEHFEKRVPEGDNRERLVCATRLNDTEIRKYGSGSR